MTLRALVADVGGTNTRLGLVCEEGLRADTVQSFRNESFRDFETVLRAYLGAQRLARAPRIVVAVAGPVSDGQARLTNRAWGFDERTLSHNFGGAELCLINDLRALGKSVPDLQDDSLEQIVSAKAGHKGNGQALVVGVGTGFNVSPVIQHRGAVICPPVEYGHVPLPLDIHEELTAVLGPIDGLTTVEECFSGRGYARLKEVTLAQGHDPASFDGFYAGLLARLCAGLLLAFLPRDGIFLAGGVARNLLAGPARGRFADTYVALSPKRFGVSAPVWSILDDAAALKGCANVALAG